MSYAVPYVAWVLAGEHLPVGTEVVQLLAREKRPVGPGTNMAEYLLLELRDTEDQDARVQAALDVLADLHESGQEIGEMVEQRRAS